MKKLSVFFALLWSPLWLPGSYIHAAPYTPSSGDEIIARWPAASENLQSFKTASRLKPNDPATMLALANAYLAQAEQPGQSRFYGLAQAALNPLIERNIADKNIWLVWAQIQQHQHNFTIALDALEKVLTQDPTNENANLLRARIFIIQEQPLAARNACLKLLGSADLLTVTACSLEANSYLHPQDLKNTYQQLADLIKQQGLPDDERGTWLIQLIADLAIRNQDWKTAADWLVKRLENASVNYLAQWGDVQLALDNPKNILSYLTPIVKTAPEMDDALLLRLALAEKKINSSDDWRNLLSERIQLREQRQDNLHSSELASYYLDINPNPKKALYWATINFANTREYNDKNLLERAQQANQAREAH